MSIHSYRDIQPAYFDRLRAAVADAVDLFEADALASDVLRHELKLTAQTLRNEATAFLGRTTACSEMADWLDQQQRRLC
jgi:hypothetical protein